MNRMKAPLVAPELTAPAEPRPARLANAAATPGPRKPAAGEAAAAAERLSDRSFSCRFAKRARRRPGCLRERAGRPARRRGR